MRPRSAGRLKSKESSVCSIHDEGLPERPIKSLKNKAGRRSATTKTKPDDSKGRDLSAKAKRTDQLEDRLFSTMRGSGWPGLNIKIISTAH